MEEKYLTGTHDEFDLWHEIIKAGEDIPPQGRINFINNVLAPDSQRTTVYSSAVPHPQKLDFFCWFMGAYPDPQKESLSLEAVKSLGFFPTDPLFLS